MEKSGEVKKIYMYFILKLKYLKYAILHELGKKIKNPYK